MFFKRQEKAVSYCQDRPRHLASVLFSSPWPHNNLDLAASPITTMISSDVLKALGYCQVQETFGMPQSWFHFTFQSLPLPSTSSGNSLLMAGSCSDGGKTPLTRKGFSAVERISDPCWMKLIRSALNSGCAGSHWVGFWQLAWLSDCNVICLQWHRQELGQEQIVACQAAGK